MRRATHIKTPFFISNAIQSGYKKSCILYECNCFFYKLIFLYIKNIPCGLCDVRQAIFHCSVSKFVAQLSILNRTQHRYNLKYIFFPRHIRIKTDLTNFIFFNITLDNFIFPLEWNQSPSSHIRVLVRNSFRLHDISITISCYPAQLYKFIFYTLLGYAPKNFPFKRL